jgi:hypothetical protein
MPVRWFEEAWRAVVNNGPRTYAQIVGQPLCVCEMISVRQLTLLAAIFSAVLPVAAQAPSDYTVRVSAIASTNPVSITLSWPRDPNATEYSLYRKTLNADDWGVATNLDASATNHVDSNVVVAGSYEYRISKSTPAYYGQGYVYAGIEVPLVESRGKVVLVVDNTHATNLAFELARLQQDLVGDGWTVLRHDVGRMAVEPANTSSNVWVARLHELAHVKGLIKADYNADPANVKAVFLFGHVPVPYSGDLFPDGHPDHRGAWPADAFYGDMDGVWADTNVNRSTAGDPRNRNVPGDGKFDPSRFPSDIELEVGRVDLANLTSFAESEEELLRRYLDKDHSFRHRVFTVERRGLIDDHFGVSTGEPFAGNGWRNFSAFFGASNAFAGDWLTTLNSQSYLWGYGCGGGSYTSCGGVVTTAQLATNDPRVVFTMMFGSYFGDTDSPGNLLRASLGTPGYTLTSVWAGRPDWQFHHMALGETIGFSTRINHNNYLYSQAQARLVHVALMGDPTLRMHPVAPPSNLEVTSNGADVDLKWNASADSVVGYAVYRAADPAGPYSRVNSELHTGTNITITATSETNYMVRAVKLEASASGTYFNASQGIFGSLGGRPVLIITAQSTNKIFGAPLPELFAAYSGFVNGDTTNDLTALATLSTSATETSPVGLYPITASGASSSNYTMVHVSGLLEIVPAQTTGLLTSSANPALPGAPVAFTLILDAVPPGAGIPAGSVQFKIDGINAGGLASLEGGRASFTTSNLAHGAHVVIAEYAGDGNFAGTTNSLSPDQLINTPPVAGPDMIEQDGTNETKVAIATLLNNDSDADGDTINFIALAGTSANGGTVVSNGGWIFYTPAPGFTNIDTFTYSIGDGLSLSVTGLVTVNIHVDNGPSPRLGIAALGDGSYEIRGDGVPGRIYRIQFSENLWTTNWQAAGAVTGDASGLFLFLDSTGSPQRFYRSVHP